MAVAYCWGGTRITEAEAEADPEALVIFLEPMQRERARI
jgi:hypothetical protein